MAKVLLRQEAIDDLSDIWHYTLHEWSENQAEKYYETIKFACKEIGKNPNIGKLYTEISKYLFGLKTGKHIILYHIAQKISYWICHCKTAPENGGVLSKRKQFAAAKLSGV